ncbi:MAG: hypothetical protein QXT74_03545 [Candidatus Nezhaarchaeales archaeon]
MKRGLVMDRAPSKTERGEYFKRGRKGLIAGLILPALVLLGLTLGLEAGRRFGCAQAFILMLAGSLFGMLVGTLILIKVLEFLYPSSYKCLLSQGPQWSSIRFKRDSP